MYDVEMDIAIYWDRWEMGVANDDDATARRVLAAHLRQAAARVELANAPALLASLTDDDNGRIIGTVRLRLRHMGAGL